MNPLSSHILRHSLLTICIATAACAQGATQKELLDAALVTGDSSQLTDSQLIAKRLQKEQSALLMQRKALLQSLYGDVQTISYDPGANTQWIRPGPTTTTIPFIIGDKGNVLAALGTNYGARSIAYGSDVISTLASSNSAHAPLFQRAMQWLVTGSPNTPIKKNFKASVVGTSSTSTISELKAAGFPATNVDCNALIDEACAKKSQLLILGSWISIDSTTISKIQARQKANLPILYIHTADSTGSSPANQILNGLSLREGPYGGNWWEEDAVAGPGNRQKAIEAAANYGVETELAKRIVSNDWRPEWGACNSAYSCNAPGFNAFASQVWQIKNTLDGYNAQS